MVVWVQAGTGCHEGGIILSKKPPEWYLSPPQTSHSDNGPRPILISVAAKKNGSACYGRSGNDAPRPILIFVAAKGNGKGAGQG